jgi:hypothetical protein
MIPVYQNNNSKEEGDCMAACIASLLEIELDDVPNFAEIYNKEKGADWYIEYVNFLSKYDLYPLTFNYDLYQWGHFHGGYVILSVDSPNIENVQHAVIGQNGKVVHDPRKGGKPVDMNRINQVEILVKKFVIGREGER